MKWTEAARERWRQRLDFAFFLAAVLVVSGLAVACLALIKTSSVQTLMVVATLGPLVLVALALAAAVRRLEPIVPGPGEAPERGKERAAEEAPRRAA